ncbi:sodium:proton antiporter [Chryseotalea sanaruensis]|uniref:Sodium:proton antiporter n=1 Tax=Chryseotalea sanaruensis TaxID=2482724 RepID=A0A401UBX6_9BACT|nr:Na+/H+ antiporter NhaC family protein [Chryseotalea sanaruensis]GCC52406.1 sodium:proton antiporter [Chryseotalea sanaruensis]
MELKRGNFWALLPLLVFIVVYFITSLILNDFYKMPMLVAFMVAALSGFLLFPSLNFHKKIDEFSKGAGDSGIMLMILIFLLAGAFAGLGKSIGAVQSTVNFALSYTSPSLLIAGLFLTACFISISLGTSVGTVVALAPIAVGVSESVPGTLGIALAAVVGGSMFGDNLSMISDTTIAATRTQKVEMRDKFKTNFWIALPPALITFLLYIVITPINNGMNMGLSSDYSFIKIAPYLFILVAALTGLHVIWVLVLGILLTFIVGLATQSTDLWSGLQAMNDGMASMFELSLICMVIGGIVGLIKYFGGIDYILYHVSRLIKSSRGAELGIVSLTVLVNAALANNTITILIVGPLAKDIADKHQVDPKRSASILDTMSCFVQGLLPYGAQLLAALAAASVALSPFEILKHLYYPYLLGISTLLFILLRKRKTVA